MPQIQDFGQKIGGARKDLWKSRGIVLNDISDMTDIERKNHVKKDNIWLKPDWVKLVSEGRSQALAYWQNKMRQSLPPRPPADTEQSQKNYIDAVTKIRDAVMAVKDPREISSFYKDVICPNFIEGSTRGHYVTVAADASGIVTNKVLKASQASLTKMEWEAEEALFGIAKEDQAYVAAKQSLSIECYDGEHVTLTQDPHDESTHTLKVGSSWGCSYYYLRQGSEFYDIDKWQKGTYFVLGANRQPLSINFETREKAEAFVEDFAKAKQALANAKERDKGTVKDSNRKKTFVPPQLQHIRYTGPDYRRGRLATSQMFLKDLKFRGGEFGNWLDNDDRQASLDMAYDALRDLARILQVRPEDTSFSGALAIAFGARGKGGLSAGAAHYEPARQVINLTKMSGAGCLAHEWGHALDHAIGSSFGVVGFASEAKPQQFRGLPESFKAVINALRYKTILVKPEDNKESVSPQLAHAKKNLTNWIASVKPSKMTPELSSAWENTVQRIFDNADSFTGSEYWRPNRRYDIKTHPDVESLSQISKFATNHVIPRESKMQICLWAKEVNRFGKQMEASEPVKKQVRTDYYQGSIDFGNLFSKYGHGYWDSICEMFARAFDCYISDKVAEQGYHSDYLSARANSFVAPNPKGGVIAAIPQGEEREHFNQLFDELITDLKERQILQATPEEEQALDHGSSQPEEPQPAHETPWPPSGTHFEQMSFEELLFSASSRSTQSQPQPNTKSQNRSR